jgi:hypothetical protein
VGTTVRKAEPDRVWQSVQWQITTVAGSTSASKLMWPQWQLPSIFTYTPLYKLLQPQSAIAT